MLDVIYYAMIGCFFSHELDAVKRHEWRVMPGLNLLPDRFAEQLFIWLHVPLFAVLLLGGDGQEANVWRIAIAAFAIIHVWLHWVFRKHPAYEFNTISSWALILLTGFFGAAYLLYWALG